MDKCSDHCSDHGVCENRLKVLETITEHHQNIIDSIRMKLNLILGGIILSPFIVAALTMLHK